MAYADTGVLISVGRNRNCIPRFKAHYEGRLRIAESVAMEVERNASPATRVDGRVRTAAAMAKASILDGGSCQVDPDENYDSLTFDEVHRKLQNLPRRADEPVHALAHLGEAASIALCIARAGEGISIVFLVNDGGASLVASQHGIPARHFGHVLGELICGGLYTSVDAFEAFTMANAVSGVPGDAAPASASALECRKSSDGQACAVCDPAAQ
ncbi:hypothetical protein F6X54_10710 [Micromonospora aurantiaca]|uniref:Uncharacterized protein n=1 Tax=Micromonospora aurantiaca (nom. illeg.) TaxID=47850 RepID=A0ABQ6UIN0_9ACTN|nr:MULTISPECIES: hypothetical protein [Micromonospora]KAB1116742.1 hypothetical protein F6X54_10710 [Micromonospora aurantiaca]